MTDDEKDDKPSLRGDMDRDIIRVDATAMAVLNRSEVEMQIDAAHKYPRSIGRFLKEAKALATHSPDIAASCIYTLPRGQDEQGRPKLITGPSVRLAEMVSSAYGNLHVGSRVLDAEDREISAQGIAWDIEKNVRVTIEARRRITNKMGKRFNDDMIVVTGNAAASIALRNAIFRVVPRAYVSEVLDAARVVAVGNAQSLSSKRKKLIEGFALLGIVEARVLDTVGKKEVADLGFDEIELLIGIGTAIKEDPSRLEEYFPSLGSVVSTGESVLDLEARLRAPKTAAAQSIVVEREAGEEG